MAKNDTKTIFNVLSAKARKKEITNTDPVSYTHLDVYKRQG